MKRYQQIGFQKGALALSGAAFLLLITPAWGQGLLFCGVAIILLCGMLWKMKLDNQRIGEVLRHPFGIYAAALVNLAFGFNFYHYWENSNAVRTVAGILRLKSYILVPACGAVLALAALPASACVISYYFGAAAEDWRKVNAEPRKEKGLSMGKCFAILVGVYGLSVLAIIRANFYYLDDLGRTIYGYKGWDNFGRHVSTAASTLLHAGDYMVDIAPLPQMVGTLLMAAAGVLMLYIVYERTRFSGWELLAVVPLAVNPYFLECVSYRFDAPYMAVSMLFGVVPLLYRNRKPGIYLFACMLGTLTVCASYQATTGVFPMLVVFMALRMWNGKEPSAKIQRFLLLSVVGYFCGLVFFKMILMLPTDAGYTSNALPCLRELLPHTVGNLLQYYRRVLADFKTVWLLLTLILAVGFVASCGENTKRKRKSSVCAGVLTLPVLLVLCFGLYPVLANTIFEPRAMYAVGALLSIFGISIAEGKKRFFFKASQMVLCWLFLVFCFTYGNALFVQKEYTDFRVKQVISDLNDLPQLAGDKEVYVQVTGNIGRSPILRNMPQNCQILNRLVPDTFSGGSDWSQYGFYLYYDMKGVVWDQTLDMTGLNLPILEEKMYHTIRGNEDYILIELK